MTLPNIFIIRGGKGPGDAETKSKTETIGVAEFATLQLGQGDFTISAWVHTDQIVDDTLGDVFSLYDPQAP